MSESENENETNPIKEEVEETAENQGEEAAGSKRKRKRKRKKKSTEEGGDDITSTGTGDASKKSEEKNKLDSAEHTVFVEGIPFVATEDEVKEFFTSNGCSDILELRLPVWQDSGRLRGFGHVVFDSVESRNKAINELNGKHLKNRYLNIQAAKDRGGGSSNMQERGPRQQPEGCRTVFVKNLPYSGIDEQAVEELFRSCGKIVPGGVRLTRNYQTKELKGFGYVEFKNPEGALSAVQKAAKGSIVLKGRTCRVDYDEGKMKGSFRNADGKYWQSQYGSVHDEQGNRKRMKR